MKGAGTGTTVLGGISDAMSIKRRVGIVNAKPRRPVLRRALSWIGRLHRHGWSFHEIAAHRFPIGGMVSFAEDPAKDTGPYEILARLPESNGTLQYRIKSSYEIHQRVAKETELKQSYESASSLPAKSLRPDGAPLDS
jgi:hypothetical protein